MYNVYEQQPFLRSKQTGLSALVAHGVLIAFVLAAAVTITAITAYAQQERDSYYANGQNYPLTISLNSLGVIAKEGVSVKQIETVAGTLELTLERELPHGFIILSLEGSRSRSELVKLAREVKQVGKEFVAQAGLVVTPVGADTPSLMTDEFIVQFRDGVTLEQIKAFNEENAVRIVMENPFVKHQFLLKVSEASRTDALEMANLYRKDDLTESAYPNFIGIDIDQQTIPNDPLFGDQWHLDNTGQGSGTVDADADLPEAWDITMGNAGTIIAVIENGGFDMGHPDLTPNLWVNPGEDLNGNGTIEPGEINGVDDDGNTYIDDFYGWDFTGCLSTSGPGCGDNDPAPGAGENHGTAVAGVAGARGNNNLGVSGSCPNCSLMLFRTGYSNADWAKSLAFGYAQAMGARIITNSWISGSAKPNTITAVNNATAAGVVVLFAAGNYDVDICSSTSYAADFITLADVIAVSSSTNQDRKVVEAAFGNCIDILAPSHRGYQSTDPFTGTLNVTTTDRVGVAGYNNTNPPGMDLTGLTETTNRDYTNFFGGTSSATPLTAGAVGLMLTVNPTLTRLQVQRLLQDTADKIEPGAAAYADDNGFSSPATGIATHSWGRLNAFEAVRIGAPAANGGKDGVDIFLRDNRLDWGNTEQPSNTRFESTRGYIGHWQSMDIKVDAPPYQTAPTAATFDAFTDETPSAATNAVNKVYVRVRNRGPETANPVTVKLHWTQFGTALPALPSDFWTAWPADSANTTNWHPLNGSGTSSSTCTITNLAYSGSSVATTAADAAQIVAFDFPAPTINPALSNHFCLLAMVDCPQDRILPISDPTFASPFIADELTPNDNNVTHRNYHDLSTTMSAVFQEGFFIRNPTNETIQAILKPEGLPEGWKIISDNIQLYEPFTLQPGQEILVTTKVSVPGLGLDGDVTFVQKRTDIQPSKVMGGVTYHFRGEPLRPRKYSLSIHGGIAVPIGAFADDFDMGWNVLADFDYHFKPGWSAVGLFGYNSFKSKVAGVDDDYWLNISANLKYNQPVAQFLSPYVSAGPGYYVSGSSNNSFGANVGGGTDFIVKPWFTLEAGADYHRLFDQDVQFIHGHGGVIFLF